MSKFGKRSLRRLSTADRKLQKLFKEVIKHFDCTVLCGYRSRRSQNEAYRKERSTKQYPNSKHNTFRSKAIDVAPYPVDWDDLQRFYFFAGLVMGIASQTGIKIRSGGDWDQDTQVNDQAFIDLPHFELVE